MTESPALQEGSFAVQLHKGSLIRHFHRLLYRMCLWNMFQSWKRKVHVHHRFFPAALFSCQAYTTLWLIPSYTFYFHAAVLIICSFIVSALGKLKNLHHLLTLTFHMNHIKAEKRGLFAESHPQILVNHHWAWRGCWLSFKHIQVIMQVSSPLVCHWPFQ